MTERKFTDDEVIRALKHCCNSNTDEPYCNDCPYETTKYCASDLSKDTLALINRQRAKIADLEDENKGLKETNEHLSGEYIALSKENDKMRKVINADVVIINRRGGKSEYAKEIIRIKTSLVKAEAYKEFAERAKEKMQDLARLDYGGNVLFLVGEKFIDELVKEFTEGG